jgi:hypothetical protein
MKRYVKMACLILMTANLSAVTLSSSHAQDAMQKKDDTQPNAMMMMKKDDTHKKKMMMKKDDMKPDPMTKNN